MERLTRTRPPARRLQSLKKSTRFSQTPTCFQWKHYPVTIRGTAIGLCNNGYTTVRNGQMNPMLFLRASARKSMPGSLSKSSVMTKRSANSKCMLFTLSKKSLLPDCPSSFMLKTQNSSRNVWSSASFVKSTLNRNFALQTLSIASLQTPSVFYQKNEGRSFCRNAGRSSKINSRRSSKLLMLTKYRNNLRSSTRLSWKSTSVKWRNASY